MLKSCAKLIDQEEIRKEKKKINLNNYKKLSLINLNYFDFP
jgi:hypothetical protein